jgi:hypothetical protein
MMNISQSSMHAILLGAAFMFGTLPAFAAGPSGGVNRGAVPLPGLTAPSRLHYTTNVETCKANGGSDGLCAPLATQGAVAFYASWNCAGCTATGFKLRLAAVKFDPRYAVRLAAPGSDAIDVSSQLPFVETPPAGGWRGQCYVVVAYRNPTRSLVSDGGGGVHPVGQATGTYEESPASSQACVTATTIAALVPASAERGYTRQYSIVYSDKKQLIQDGFNHTSFPLDAGYKFIAHPAPLQGQTNIFYRSAYSFERPQSLGDVTVLGGAFAYDGQSCSNLYTPAPSGWGGATWTKPTGTRVTMKWTKSGSGESANVDAFVRGWNPGKTLTFFLEPHESPEFDQSGLENPSWSCVGSVSNVRLILSVGVTK